LSHCRIPKQKGENFDLLIGADSIVVLDEEIIEKPTDPDDAKRILRNLSGQSHFVFSAVVLLTPNYHQNTNRTVFVLKNFDDVIVNSFP
jgi:septum formation protein